MRKVEVPSAQRVPDASVTHARMLTHVGVFAVDFSRIDTGKTVCFLVSGGLSAVLSRVVYVNYSSVSIRP